MDILAGWKTYIAAAGLLGLALYQATQQQYDQALQNFLAALAAFGIKKAIARQ